MAFLTVISGLGIAGPDLDPGNIPAYRAISERGERRHRSEPDGRRRAIRKYLRAGTAEPQFLVPERPSKLDPYAEKLAACLKTEAGKPRKQRRTLKQLHAERASLGYEGSYNRVAAFARRWKEERQRESRGAGRGAFVPLAFEPGEAFQFDRSEAMTKSRWATIGGEHTKLQVAHIKLAHSRVGIAARTGGAAMATPRPGLSAADPRDAVRRPLAWLRSGHPRTDGELPLTFGGVPRRGSYDSSAWRRHGPRPMPDKTAVDRVGKGKARQVNARGLEHGQPLRLEPEFCNPAAGWERAISRHWSERQWRVDRSR